MPHRITKLKASDIVLIVDETFAHHYIDHPIKTFEQIPVGVKLKLEQVDTYDNLLSQFWFMFNGNYCSTYWLNGVKCKDISHSPTECKSCEFLNKGCIQ